jgi:hypothetical protein
MPNKPIQSPIAVTTIVAEVPIATELTQITTLSKSVLKDQNIQA